MNWMFLLLCTPAMLMGFVWYWLRRTRQWPNRSGLIATILATVNAALGATFYIRFRLYPTPDNIPPWKDSLVLDTGMLGLLAPLAIILGLVAAAKGAPGWLVTAIILTSIPLGLVGCAAGVSV